MIILLMGVAGSGKTTIGKLLAARLGCLFYDADDLHPAANREKMHRGISLTDEDRRPWLEALRDLIAGLASHGDNAVVACSMLKEWYRRMIAPDRSFTKIFFLRGSYELIAERLARRHGHFFDPHLLRSQFDTLEEPADAVAVDISRDPGAIVESIEQQLHR
jgi:gluconokinase